MSTRRQNKQAKQRKFRIPLQAYLSYLVVCTLLLTGVSFSRYISTAGGSDNSRVAKGVVTVSYDDNDIVEMSREQGEVVQTKDFSFSVSNEESEVAIRYNLVLTLNQPLPAGVTISLYKNDDKTPIRTFYNNGETQFTVSNAGIFKAGSQETDQYKLTFTGDFNTIDEGCTRTVSISVQSEQID